MQKKTERRFTPLGVDHITFAVYDRHFWERALARFGFETIRSRAAERDSVVAMRHGDVNIVLADPETSAYASERIEQALLERGDMQVFSASILVDSVLGAQQELLDTEAANILFFDSGRDPFGEHIRVCLRLPYETSTIWELIQRPTSRHTPPVSEKDAWKSRGVDHFAIGVKDLAKWEAWYQAMGFETIYAPPHDKIRVEHSGMKTVAVQRGGWVVALVEGVDMDLPSQVSTYVEAHGDHAIQHAAIRFTDLVATVRELAGRGAHFRLRRKKEDLTGDFTDVIHEGQDHSGPLYQCFTKPWATNDGMGGFFFELIQRLGEAKKAEGGKSAFHDPTVIGLYESIELEELADDKGLVFPEELMEGYAFDEWRDRYYRKQNRKQTNR